MEIVFLGTTAAVPTKERNHSAIALLYRGEVILWDCGEGTQRQLIKAKVNYMRISKIFITHLHADHFLGIPGLIQTMGFSGRDKPLKIFGPEGIEDLMENILSLGFYEKSFEIEVKELEEGVVVEEKDYAIETFEVKHSVPAFGLLFREKKGRKFLREKAEALGIPPGPLYKRLHRGESVEFEGRIITPDMVLGEPKEGFKVLYTGDTRPLEKILEKSRGAVLIHDSTFSGELEDNARENLHSTAREAAETAKKAGAKALYLTHISPRYKEAELLEAEAREIFQKSFVARDLMRVNLHSLKF